MGVDDYGLGFALPGQDLASHLLERDLVRPSDVLDDSPSGMPSSHPSNLVNEALGGGRRDQSVRYAHFVTDRQRCGDCLGVNSPGTVVISIWLPSASITFRLLRSYVVWPSTTCAPGPNVVS